MIYIYHSESYELFTGDRFLASLLALEVDKSRTSIIMKTLPNSEKGGEEHNEKPLSGTIFDNIKSWKLQTTKVTPDRAYSTAFYPSSEKLVITVGDLSTRWFFSGYFELILMLFMQMGELVFGT